MNRSILVSAVVFAMFAIPLHAYDASDWPTHYTVSDGTDIGVVGAYRYDINEFIDDRKPDDCGCATANSIPATARSRVDASMIARVTSGMVSPPQPTARVRLKPSPHPPHRTAVTS